MNRITKFAPDLDSLPDNEKSRRIDEALEIFGALIKTAVGLSPR